ncbi:MAG: hypothetical protein AB7N65_14640 [Vicinamibacterales bacterium]
MFSHAIALSCTVLALATVPMPSFAQAGTQSSGATRDASMSHTDALAALQDARVTIARLTEASMPQDAREALARVSTAFRTVYKAYTGEEPTPQKTAAQAAQARQPAADWEQSFNALSSAVDAVVGSPARSGAVGTSGSGSGAAVKTSELTTPVRQDFQVLREQLDRFGKAAGHHAPR